MIRVRTIVNRIEGRAETPWEEHEFLGQCLRDFASIRAAACVVNGERVIKWGETGWEGKLGDGDELVFVETDSDPVTITLAVIATVGFMTTTYLQTGNLLAFAGLAGSIYAMMSVKAPSAPKLGDNLSRQSSATYGFDAIRNDFGIGNPVQVQYGKMVTGGHIIAAWREPDQDGNEFLKTIISFGEGPIKAIGQYDSATCAAMTSGDFHGTTSGVDNLKLEDMPEGMTINDIEATQFNKTYANLRLGTNDQTCLPGFQDLHVEYAQPGDFKLFYNKTLVYYCKDYRTGVAANLVFPALYQTDKLGKQKSASVSVRMRVYDEDDILIHEHTAKFKGTWTSRHSVQVKKDRLPLGLYRLELTRTTKDFKTSGTRPQAGDLILGAIREIQNDTNFSYPNTALMGLKIKATGQISGSFPRVLVPTDGRLVDVPDDDTFSTFTPTFTQNPAWIHRDAMTHPRYGGGNVIDVATDYDNASAQGLADDAVEAIPKYTGSMETEERYQFDGIFDTPRGLWDTGIAILSTCRAIPLMRGNLISIKQEKETPAQQFFSIANVKQGTFGNTYTDPVDRFNSVEGGFLDRDSQYQQSTVISQDRRITTDGVKKIPTTVDLFGITRKTQAKRQTSYYYRWEQLVHDGGSFEVGVQGIGAEPLDIVMLAGPTEESGLLKEADGDGNAVLARAFTFLANQIYSYLEQNPSTEEYLVQNFVVSVEQETDTLPFAPLYGGSGFGRKYAIGRHNEHVQKAIMFTVEHMGNGTSRRLNWINHSETLFTDETTEDIGSGIYIPPLAGGVLDVTDIEVVETSVDPGESILTVTWIPTADVPETYNVYTRTESDTEFQLVGDAASPEFVFTSDDPLGFPIEIGIQTIRGSDGAVNDPFPSIVHVIQRETLTSTLVEFPDNVDEASLLLTPVALDEYEFTWDPVATFDSYEVRLGEWASGVVVYEGVPETCNLKLPRVECRIVVRAKKGDYYSPAPAVLTQAATTHPTYPTLSASDVADFLSEGTAQNTVSINDWNEYGTVLLQNLEDLPTEYLSKTFDLASSAATHVTAQVRTLPYMDDNGSEIYGTMQHWSPAGEIQKEYISWTLTLETSPDGSTWTPLDFKAVINGGAVITARYFRFRFRGESLVITDPDDANEDTRLARVMLEKFEAAFARA